MNYPGIFLLIIAFLTGLCFGSFLNVLVYRLPLKKSIVAPPSSCPSCAARLSLVDLIPLFGYMLLRGRCRYCGAKISARYPLIELTIGLLFLFMFLKFGLTMKAFYNLTLLYLLIGITLIDLEYRIVPNTLVAAGLILGALMQLPNIFSYWFEISPSLLTEPFFNDAVLGFLVGGALLLIVFLVSRGGMGAGDVKLIAMIGYFVGLRGTALVLLLAFLFGALVGVTFMLLGRLTRKDALPFAPYLSLATFIEVFWGELIWNWYMNLLL